MSEVERWGGQPVEGVRRTGTRWPSAPRASLMVAIAALLLASAVMANAAVAVVGGTILLLASQAFVLCARVRRWWSSSAARARHLAGAGVRIVLLLPFFLVLSLLGRVLRLGLRTTGEPGWVPRGPSRPNPARAFTSRPARPRGGGTRPLRTVALTVVAVVVLEAAIAGVVVARSRTPERSLEGVASVGALDSAALRDLPWRDAAAAELGEVSASTVFVPYTGLALQDYQGTYVNVANRMRRTYTPDLAMDDALDVWFFGGSTTFGFDLQRDEHTIPSEVVRLAEADGIAIRARNYGAPGYVNFQEAVLLAMLLGVGEQPDLVVFYDGVNDVAAQLLNVFAEAGPPGEPTYIMATRMRDALAGSEFLPEGSSAPPSPLATDDGGGRALSVDSIVTNVVEAYATGVDLVQLLAGRHDFAVARYWQPDLYSRQPLDPGERALFPVLDLDEAGYDTLVGLNRRIREALPSRTVDLSEALDQVEGPVLSDVAHLNERGGRAVAEAMYSDLRPSLLRLREEGPGEGA